MRRCACLAVLLLAAGTCPAGAQFEDLIREAERAAGAREGDRIPGGRKVTLELRRVPVKEAVTKLAEAAQLTLSCAPDLAERKVTLLAREQSASTAVDALARAVHARWRAQGDGLVLEPAPVLEMLKPEEITTELQHALQGAGVLAERELDAGTLGAMFTPEQVGALHAGRELRVPQLAPQQRASLAMLLRARIANTLRLAGERTARAKDLSTVTLNLGKWGDADTLRITSPMGGMEIPLGSHPPQR